jgi:hypothetical protein
MALTLILLAAVVSVLQGCDLREQVPLHREYDY